MSPLASAGLLVRIALGNLVRHRAKTLIVGSIMLFGTALLVLGNALLDSVEHSMERSITSSIAGQLQLYSADAKDELALFGGMTMSRPDVGVVPDFAKLKSVVAAVPNVEAVVPMGLDTATASTPADLDLNLQELRAAVKRSDQRAVDAAAALVRQHAALLIEELRNLDALSSDTEKAKQGLADLQKVAATEFWGAEFQQDPYAALEFLENRIAPLGTEGRMLYLRYLGTDLDLFEQKFDRFKVVSGETVPSGRRGFLMNHKFREDWVKHLVARELDKVAKARKEGTKIAEDPVQQERVKRNSRQYQRLLFQLDPDESAKLEAELRKLLPDTQGDLAALTQKFLEVDDSNFDQRYEFFYRVIAPMIRLYDVNVGDVMTVTAYTRSGYVKSLNLKVYGTFTFEGVESSDLAGSFSLVDIASFRELLGLMTADRKEELAAIRAKVGVKDVAREDAEDALFGDSDAVVSAGNADGFAMPEQVGTGATAWDLPITAADLDNGVVLNAAVILKDPEKVKETQKAVQAALDASGMKLRVVDWQTAAGLVGQFILVIRLVLYLAIFIIFVVAMVIINNSMVMALMERVNEIGTMRAIGAQKRLVLAMFLLETVVLGLVAGGLGAGLGAGITLLLGQTGIPAGSDILVFLFGGPRLYPTTDLGHQLTGLVIILVVSLISTLQPARLATRVQPIEAMRSEE